MASDDASPATTSLRKGASEGDITGVAAAAAAVVVVVSSRSKEAVARSELAKGQAE